MINFKDFEIIDDDLLSQLNTAIDKVIDEKKNVHEIDYSTMEVSTWLIAKESRHLKQRPLRISPQFSKNEIISYALNFYQSLGSKLYNKVLHTFFQIDPTIKLNIYDLNEPKTLGEKNEFGHNEYEANGFFNTSNGNATISVPLRNNLKKNSNEVQKYPLGCIYTLVHEIAHSLDWSSDKYKEAVLGKPINQDADYFFSECTSIGFEYLLSQYLLAHSNIPQEAILEETNHVLNSTRDYAVVVYAKLLLAKEKEKSGTISKDFIEQTIKKCKLTKEEVNNISMEIINNSSRVSNKARYALSRLISPTILQVYNRQGISGLNNYLDASKTGSIHDVFTVLGIDSTKKSPTKYGYAKLIRNVFRFEDLLKNFNYER